MSGVKQAMTQAIHSENLTPGADPGQQHDVERLTALGLVGTESLRARLGTLLLRLDAGDLGCRQEAIAVLSSWLAKHREVERSWHLQQASSLLRLFAAMLLTEWLYPQCAACGGAGTQPQAPDRANPRGWRCYCQPCKGRGLRAVDHAARATAMGLTFSIYQRHWEKRFNAAHKWLSWVGIEKNLQRRLSRGTFRPSR